MASRPPDDVARKRWLAIQAVRLGGGVMVVFALAALRGVVPFPEIAAYVMLVVGLLDVFLVPTLLARKWRSPRP
ncbi:hypothetical protein GRI89_00915 [Altererythrobacter salegens]|uniref:Uncharacterized protein n=1 Tax=Croceibacterium salegens TaxID=1737568 RepID=A0A6I4SSY3_9SPHN|nr:hypothetical protein [Croceibacterium salegens]MXO58107.1 hypothetical protein [Croceibacterium salegens]